MLYPEGLFRRLDQNIETQAKRFSVEEMSGHDIEIKLYTSTHEYAVHIKKRSRLQEDNTGLQCELMVTVGRNEANEVRVTFERKERPRRTPEL